MSESHSDSKTLSFYPLVTETKHKNWMDAVLVEGWVRKKFNCEERIFALMIDNCPACPQIENLKIDQVVSCDQTQLLRLSK